MKIHKNPSAEKLKKLLTRQRLQSGFSFLLGGLLIFQMVQFYQFRERLQFIDDLYDRNANVLSDLGKGKEYLSSFGTDLNEIRQFLLLPTKTYDFSDMDEVDLASEGDGTDLNTELFDFVNSLGKYEQNQALYGVNSTAVQAALSDPVWNAAGLRLLSTNGQVFDDRVEWTFVGSGLDDATLLRLDLGYDGLFTVPLFYRELGLKNRGDWASVFGDIKDYLNSDLSTARKAAQLVNEQRAVLKTFLASQDVQQLLTDKAMALSMEQEDEETYFYQLRNSQLAALGTFSVAKQDGQLHFSVDQPVDEDFEGVDFTVSDASAALAALRDEVDARTDLQKKIAAKELELEGIMQDRAFVATLGQLGLRFGATVETDSQIQYPLLDAQGATLRVIFIDKATAEVNVMMPDGQKVQSLSLATEELIASSKKKLWTCLILFPVTLG